MTGQVFDGPQLISRIMEVMRNRDLQTVDTFVRRAYRSKYHAGDEFL